MAVILVAAMAAPARADVQLSAYLGANLAQDSEVRHSVLGKTDVSWDGEPLESPPYFGFRGTWWFAESPWGLGLEFTHAKAAADPLPPGYTTLEMTNGLNLLTADLFYRYLNDTAFTPYAGLGAGVSVPHVEVAGPGLQRTYDYLYTGIALEAIAGVDLRLSEHWSVFGEYKFSYSRIKADLDGGATLKTDMFLHHVALGVALSF